jgi:hypothetical protein
MLIALKIGKSFEYMGLETDPRGILSTIHESMIYGSRVGLFPELHAPLAYLAAKAGLPIPFGGVGAFITKQSIIGEVGSFLVSRAISSTNY